MPIHSCLPWALLWRATMRFALMLWAGLPLFSKPQLGMKEGAAWA